VAIYTTPNQGEEAGLHLREGQMADPPQLVTIIHLRPAAESYCDDEPRQGWYRALA
jgi:hypothetical protein